MGCLDESTILGFLEGQLDDERAASAEAHLAACGDCRRLISELARSSLVVDAVGQTIPHAAAESTPSENDGSRQTALVAGAVVAGRFLLDRPLGEGGVGTVWAARNLGTRKPVALKFLKGLASESSRRRFYREARAQSAIAHPNVVQIHDVLDLDDGSPLLVMELLHGESLRERLVRDGKIPLDALRSVVRPVLSALSAAHAAGIVHRDLKPENIFLCARDGAAPDVKVLDFGIAKLTAAIGDAAATHNVTRTGDMLGTPFYMSPEQAFGADDIDVRTDHWALGVILYECLSGRRPFDGKNVGQIIKAVSENRPAPLGELRRDLPAMTCNLVHRLLSSERSERPSLDEVRRVLDGESLAPRAPPRRSAGARVALAIALASVLGGGALALRALRAQRSKSPWSDAQMPVAAPLAPRALEPPAPSRSVDGSVAPTQNPPSASHRAHRAASPSDRSSTLPGGVVDEVPF